MFFPLKKLEGKKGKNGISNLIQKTTIKNKFFRFSFFFFEIPSDYSPVFLFSRSLDTLRETAARNGSEPRHKAPNLLLA